jgi:hypothetical protein
MPRHHQRNGAGKGGQGNFATAWAKGNYNQAERAGGSSGEEDDGPSFSGRCSVPLAMWDLGQCDRKRYVFMHGQLHTQPKPIL